MDRRLVALIQRAVHSRRELFPQNAGWQHLHREYNIGTPDGNKIRISARDKDGLVDLVRQMTGLDLRKSTLEKFAQLSRSEALAHSRREKWAGRAVSGQRLALKALPGRPLGLNEKAVELLTQSHLDIAAESIESLEHDSILLIENYECFDRLERLNWTLGECFENPLVMYRGDPNTSRADAANEFLRVWKRPVLAMVDIDPAGLLIAQALPFAAGLVAPKLATVDVLLADGDPGLYHRQRPAAEHALLNSPYPAVRKFWELIERHQQGLVQERWLAGDVELVIHPFS